MKLLVVVTTFDRRAITELSLSGKSKSRSQSL